MKMAKDNERLISSKIFTMATISLVFQCRGGIGFIFMNKGECVKLQYFLKTIFNEVQ